MREEHKCVDSVWVSFGNGHGTTGACGNKGKVEVDGKWYCGVHSSEAKAKREAKSNAKWQAKKDRWDAEAKEHEYNRKAADACRALGLDDPSKIDAALRRAKAEGMRLSKHEYQCWEDAMWSAETKDVVTFGQWIDARAAQIEADYE